MISGLGDLIKYATTSFGIRPGGKCEDRAKYLNEKFPFRRQLSDGTLVFPKRGPAPPVPEGYEAKVGDPYVLYLIWEPCEFRTSTILKSGCCGPKEVPVCTKYKTRTDRLNCSQCVFKGENV